VHQDLLQLVRGLRAALVDFQPELSSGEDCALLVEALARTEKVCAAARVRAAARAGVCGVHKERGFADVSDWMARASGSSAGSAKAALDTAAALETQPEQRLRWTPASFRWRRPASLCERKPSVLVPQPICWPSPSRTASRP
jgi:hypothetical protein